MGEFDRKYYLNRSHLSALIDERLNESREMFVENATGKSLSTLNKWMSGDRTLNEATKRKIIAYFDSHEDNQIGSLTSEEIEMLFLPTDVVEKEKVQSLLKAKKDEYDEFFKQYLHKPNLEVTFGIELKRQLPDVHALERERPTEVSLFNELVGLYGDEFANLKLVSPLDIQDQSDLLKQNDFIFKDNRELFKVFVDRLVKDTDKSPRIHELVEKIYHWLEMKEEPSSQIPDLVMKRDPDLERASAKGAKSFLDKECSFLKIQSFPRAFPQTLFLIPGARTVARIDALGGLLMREAKPTHNHLIVLTGDKPRTESRMKDHGAELSEAELYELRLLDKFADYVTLKGKHSNVIVERSAKDTFDNMSGLHLGLRDLERSNQINQAGLRQIVIITNPFHIRRTFNTATAALDRYGWSMSLENHGIQLYVIGCNSKYDAHNWHIEDQEAGCQPYQGLNQILLEVLKNWGGRLVGEL